MKYDDAAWHYGGVFPKELPKKAGARHIGMFAAWLVLNGFGSDELHEDAEESISALKSRLITGAEFVMKALDGKLTDQDLSDDGNAFAVAYYQGLDNDSRYVDDYFKEFGVGESTLYEVPDTWENYDKFALRMSERFGVWVENDRPEFVV